MLREGPHLASSFINHGDQIHLQSATIHSLRSDTAASSEGRREQYLCSIRPGESKQLVPQALVGVRVGT
jgi:hypothetical protein